jgi:hypothetical protein
MMAAASPQTAHPQANGKRYARSSLQVLRLTGPRLRLISKQLRLVYQQYDGEIALACECKCEAWWDSLSFYVRRRMDCPIDEHRAHYLQVGEKKLRP